MSLAKTHLKTARDAISKKDYTTARKESSLVLDFEPENYNAHVFLGLALLELGESDKSEQVYQRAVELSPAQPLAWQGLSNFYGRQHLWEKQADIQRQLLNLFNKNGDAVKCAEVLQKLVALYREYGSPSQVVNALSYYLPDSSIYKTLSMLPPPDPSNPTSTSTYDSQEAIHNGFNVLDEIVRTTERIEENEFKREVEKRRTRLGAPGVDQLRKEVFLEIYNKSKLPILWNAMLNHPYTSDALRFEIETNQLDYKQRHLLSISFSDNAMKKQISRELDELVEGVVILQKANKLGWILFFEGKDCEEISGYDRSHIQQFIKLFPGSSFSTLFKGYFAYLGQVLYDGDEDEDKELFSLQDDDPMDAVLLAYQDLTDTILGNRLLSEMYLIEIDYENAIKTSKRGLQKLKQLESETGKSLSRTRTALQSVLASSLVNFFPPKHHKEANSILSDILGRSPQHIAALMNRGFILEAASDWKEAASMFDQVSSLLDEDTKQGIRAREESAWCKSQFGDPEVSLRSLQNVLAVLDDIEGDTLDVDRARCLWRIGKISTGLDEPHIQSAYKYFINALKKDPEFAPAFTSLGIYYLEHSTPPDPIRSSKCFQKAFELDARETTAGRRLAEGFANDREWDLVQVVAQRTIDGEGGLDAGLTKAELDPSTKYLPTNSWAWKAIGIVKFHYKDYPEAIKSFQVALRVDPDDQPLWVRLGEAYNKAGRHIAALKALNHALNMNPDDWLCSYTIGEVKHCMGLFEETISGLEDIRKVRPDEAGILALLSRAYLDQGRAEICDGFQVRAEESFVNAIYASLDMIKRVPGHRTIAWKMIADATFELSSFDLFSDHARLKETLQAIPFVAPHDSTEGIAQMIPLPSLGSDVTLTSMHLAALAIHACLSRITLYSISQTGNSVAWYDLGVVLQLWTLKSPPIVDISSLQEKIIECLKKALQLDASHVMYWVALGNAYFLSHPKAAQHAYVKALDLDPKFSTAWISLGLLYYYHGDIELANEALYCAQVLDPDNAMAWVGQFLIASTNNHSMDATLLLEHAVGLQTSASEGYYEYAFQVFSATKGIFRSHQVHESLLPAFFVLDRYCRQRPKEVSGLHLLALVCERLGHIDLGAKLVERAIGILEAIYEENEDPEVEKKYTIANATLGRLKLSQGAYAESVGYFGSIIGLLEDKGDNGISTKTLKVQARLGLGLAHFFLNDLEEGLKALEDGLVYAQDDLVLRGHIAILLAQTLWAIGTEEAKETAKAKLLESIALDPENLIAINTLAGMGVVTDDSGLVDAALSEILGLPIDEKYSMDPQRHVNYLLIQHYLAQGGINDALSIAQHAVNTEPSGLGQRNMLATLMLQSGQNKADTVFALLGGLGKEGTYNRLGDADEAAAALGIQAMAQIISARTNNNEEYSRIPEDALMKAQRAIMMRPSNMKAWHTLAYVQAQARVV